jgi:hypothetical protein
MALLDTVVSVTHLLFASLWTGSVVFVAWAIPPLAAGGDLEPGPLGDIAASLRTTSRVSVLVLFVTGGHLAGTRHTVDSLLGSTTGWLVLAMLALWFVLAGLVEVGTGRLIDGTDREKVREPARRAKRPFQAATVVALLLLVDGGLIAVGV